MHTSLLNISVGANTNIFLNCKGNKENFGGGSGPCCPTPHLPLVWAVSPERQTTLATHLI